MTDRVANRDRERVQTAVHEIERIDGELAIRKQEWLDERNGLNAAKSKIFKDAKASGLNTKALKDLIKNRQAGEPDLEHQAVVDQYTLYLEDVPAKLVKQADDDDAKPVAKPKRPAKPATKSATGMTQPGVSPARGRRVSRTGTDAAPASA